MCKDFRNVDYDKLTVIRDKLSDLSSIYYQLIPTTRWKNQIPQPLNHESRIK